MDPTALLQLAQVHPSVTFADGDTVIAAGSTASALFVLESGALDVRVGDRVIAHIAQPGSVVGEIGLLLGTPATAHVAAAGEATLRRIDDADALFTDHPGFGRHLAVVLAERLRQVTSFLGDLEDQFADRPGTLGLVPAVLTGLLGGSGGSPVDTGSDREPDAPY